MKQTEEQYANELIDRHSEILASVNTLRDDIIKCAIQDVENTIEALNEIDIPLALLEFYQNVLQILKDKL